jgi:exosortase/archaeosortase family protein
MNLEFFLQVPLLWGIVKVLLYVLLLLLLLISIYGFEFVRYLLIEFRKEIIIFSTVSIGFFIVMLLFQNLWIIFSSGISKFLFWIFSLFFRNVQYYPYIASDTMTEGGGPLLVLGNFSAIIGKPCSGIDSLLLFISLYVLIYCLDYRQIKRVLAAVLFMVGICGMFLVNIFRIFLLFVLGAYVSEEFAVGLFHANVGWILFIVYFGVYWFLASKIIYKA